MVWAKLCVVETEAQVAKEVSPALAGAVCQFLQVGNTTRASCARLLIIATSAVRDCSRQKRLASPFTHLVLTETR